VKQEDYVWDLLGDGTICHLLFAENDNEIIVLGIPAFQGYYISHNLDSSTMTFSPLEEFNKFPLVN